MARTPRFRTRPTVDEPTVSLTLSRNGGHHMQTTGKRLEGKVAIVTGATGGIGEATAKRFLEEGASVMLVGRSQEKLNETCERLAAFSGLADFVADAGDEAATAASVAATVEAFGGIDVLIANAGT